MNVQQIVNSSVSLTAVPKSQANFSVPLLLVDHSDIPIDKRYRTVSKTSYATDLTASTNQANWCAALWGQNYNVASAYIGRWVSSASSPYIYFPSYVQTIASYTAISDFYLKFDDGSNQDEIGPIDCTSGVTTMADVASKIDTALGNLVTPNITGLESATCALDAYSRPKITHASVTGSGAVTISTTAASTGTDLRGALYWGSGTVQAGLDAEALDTALGLVLALDNTPFVICQRGGSIAEVVAFSTGVNARDKILLLVSNDTDTKDSSATTDFAYQIEALSHQKTHITYTEHTTQHPDAAICGEVIPRPPGSASFALNALTGLSQSGLHGDGSTVIPLTDDERTALEAKGADYLIKPSNITHLRHGLAVGGNEMRVRIGMAYMAAKVAEGYYAYMLAQDVVTYSDEDIQAMANIVKYYAEILVDRKLFQKDAYTITMPSAADFTAAVKATHTMTLSNILDAPILSSVNDVVATMAFTIN